MKNSHQVIYAKYLELKRALNSLIPLKNYLRFLNSYNNSFVL